MTFYLHDISSTGEWIISKLAGVAQWGMLEEIISIDVPFTVNTAALNVTNFSHV